MHLGQATVVVSGVQQQREAHAAFQRRHRAGASRSAAHSSQAGVCKHQLALVSTSKRKATEIDTKSTTYCLVTQPVKLLWRRSGE